MYKVLFSTLAQAEDTLDITDSAILTTSIIDVYSDNEGLYAAGISVSDHTLTITFDGTLSGGNIAVVVNNIEGELVIPSKTSQLQNDSGYITENDIPTIPTKTSQLENDSGFITIEDVPTSEDVYSETETKIGKYLGEDLYRKVIQTNYSSLSSDTFTYDVGYTTNNMKRITKAYWCRHGSSVSQSGIFYCWHLSSDSDDIVHLRSLVSSTNLSGAPIQFILEYTKNEVI